jgi:uncharacterized protein Yka (UPF0111/DUF47 family)
MQAPPVGLERLPGEVARLLEEAADNAKQAATELAQLLQEPTPQRFDQLERREGRGERITHDLTRALRNQRVASRDRGLLRELAEAVDDVVDSVREAGADASSCDCGASARQLAQVLRDMSRANARATRLLEAEPGQRVAELDKVLLLRKQGERLLREAVAVTLMDRSDPLGAMMRHDCLERLAAGIAAARRVALAAERSAAIRA